MRLWKLIFSVLVIIFSMLGLMHILDYSISMPIAFVFLGLIFMISAKERYLNGKKLEAIISIAVTIFIYIVTAVIIISKFIRI